MKNQTGPFLVKVTLLNLDKNAQFGFFHPGKEFGPYPDIKTVFQEMRREWGGKISSIYLDRPDGSTIKIGWLFTKRTKYENCSGMYTREAWVEVIREIEPARPAQYQSVSIV